MQISTKNIPRGLELQLRGVLGLGHLRWDLGTPGGSALTQSFGMGDKAKAPAPGDFSMDLQRSGMRQFWLRQGIPPRLGSGLVLSQAGLYSNSNGMRLENPPRSDSSGNLGGDVSPKSWLVLIVAVQITDIPTGTFPVLPFSRETFPFPGKYSLFPGNSRCYCGIPREEALGAGWDFSQPELS